MSGDWLTRMPAEAHGLPVQRPVRADIEPPPGFSEAVPLVDPFEAHCFATFRRRNADGSTTYAMQFDDRHGNGRGVVHGGLLMTLADSILGYSTFGATDGSWCVTVSQSSQFLRAARVGDVVECTPVVTRRTRSMLFTRGDFLVKGEAIFAAASIWKIQRA